jgi:hypothetical protein
MPACTWLTCSRTCCSSRGDNKRLRRAAALIRHCILVLAAAIWHNDHTRQSACAP